MGGEGAIAEWALEDPPRAQKDHVHFTREGYQQMGVVFAFDLLRSFVVYHSNNQPSPTPNNTPNHPTTNVFTNASSTHYSARIHGNATSIEFGNCRICV